MQVSELEIKNFRGIKTAKIGFDGHVLLVGRNNVGKSTICEALEFVLSPDRQYRFPPVEEFDFYNAGYLGENGEPVPITIEVLLTDVTPTIENACFNHLERWDTENRRVLGEGDIDQVDKPGHVWALRLLFIGRYNVEEDEFEAATHFAKSYDPEREDESRVSRAIRRTFGFLYLRTLRTGSRALTLERGSLLDVILRLQKLNTGIWEHVRERLQKLDPPIQSGATNLTPVLNAIEQRLAEYIQMDNPGEATGLFVSRLTREHLRETLSFFVSMTADQKPVPFQDVGTGTLNTLVLALLSFIAELKEENVIFAMEEPEIALPPHTQRRVANYLLESTTQCFVTSHSPYVIESFRPEQIKILRRSNEAKVSGKDIELSEVIKAKTYRKHIRRGIAEAMLGRAVVIAEGITEVYTLAAVSQKMELSNDEFYALDLSGVTIFSAEGDGSVGEFGAFFGALELPAYALLDKKQRNSADQKNIDEAGFQLVTEIPYKGMESLLAREVPITKQWMYLEAVRDSVLHKKYGIPDSKPEDEKIRSLTTSTLKDGKGWGRAAELIECCDFDELPSSLTTFLRKIYEEFPRPKHIPIEPMGANDHSPELPVTPTTSLQGHDGDESETSAS